MHIAIFWNGAFEKEFLQNDRAIAGGYIAKSVHQRMRQKKRLHRMQDNGTRFGDALQELRITRCNCSQCIPVCVGGWDALQELWITRCIGELPLQRCIRTVSVCRTKEEGLSGFWGETLMLEIFWFSAKSPFYFFIFCPLPTLKFTLSGGKIFLKFNDIFCYKR